MGIYRCSDLKVYNDSFAAAMKVFYLTKGFPSDERYSLVDQMRRSSRSVTANIREGFAKRRYKDVFVRHLNDALGSAEETQTWLAFSFESGYIQKESFQEISKRYAEIGAMIYTLMKKWN